MSIENTVNQIVAEAKATGLSLTSIAQMIVAAWNAPPTSNYGSDGMSHPAEGTGLVRFKELDEQRQTYLADGQLEAANQLRYSYACFPGAKACEPNSIEQYCAATNTASATTFRGMGLADWYAVHPAVEHKNAFGNTYFSLNGTAVITDAFAIPHEEKGTGKPINRTPAECVAFMLENAAQWVK